MICADGHNNLPEQQEFTGGRNLGRVMSDEKTKHEPKEMKKLERLPLPAITHCVTTFDI